MTEAGRVVVLNGTSSAGKTTIARAFRDRRAAAGDFWLMVGIDDVLSKLPAEWLDLGLPIGRGRYAADGLRLESTAAGPDLRVGVHCALDVAEARERAPRAGRHRAHATSPLTVAQLRGCRQQGRRCRSSSIRRRIGTIGPVLFDAFDATVDS